jgi:ankyrin repeat protein
MQLLVRYKADLDAQDQRGMTAVALAAERGDLPTLDALLAAGARLDAPLRGADLLERVIEARHAEMIAALLARGLDVRTPPTKAFWRLVDKGDTANVRLLIAKGVDVNERRGQEALLQRALFRKQWEIAGMLLDAGAAVRAEEAASVAALASFHPPMLARLRAAGVDVDAAGGAGKTALATLLMERPMSIRAAGGGTAAGVAQNAVTGETVVTTHSAPVPVKEIPAPDNVARVKALLGSGADVNRKIGEETPLMLAVRSPGKSRELAEALIDAGGRIDVDLAIPFSDKRGEERGGLFGVAPEVTAGMNIGPLTWVLMNKQPDIAIRLMKRDRKIARADRDLLYFAATLAQWDALVAAVPYGANVATADRAGVTPLMLAANVGQVAAVRAMLDGGANVNARSAQEWPPFLERNFMAQGAHGHGPPPLVGGYTALRAAREKKHDEVVKLLAAAGARE